MLRVISNPYPVFIFDNAQRLDLRSHPHHPHNGSNHVPATIPNVQHLLVSYGKHCFDYNTIRKTLSFCVIGHSGIPDSAGSYADGKICAHLALPH